MNYFDFLEIVINEGVQSAEKSYSSPTQKDKKDGAIAGFNACRRKEPMQLKELLNQSRKEAVEARTKENRYWYFRCYSLEVEWTCNVISAMLLNEGIAPIIIEPTLRGTQKAAEILKRAKLIINN